MVSYIHQSGDWKYANKREIDDRVREDNDLRREMDFISNKNDSFIEAFSILGYKDGSVAISINYRNHYRNAPRCFEELGIDLSANIYDHFYITTNVMELRNIFKIIKQLGKIPAPYLEKINKVVAAGQHAIKPEREPKQTIVKSYATMLADMVSRFPK